MQQSRNAIERFSQWAQLRWQDILSANTRWTDSRTEPRRPWIEDTHSQSCEPRREEPCLQAINVTKDSLVAARVRLAMTSDERRRGLLGRDQLDSDEGLYVVPAQWVQLMGMRFAIDIAFLSPSGRVLFVCRNIKPNRLSRPVWRAEGALELPAGVLDASRTEVGDIIELRVPTSETKFRRVI